MNPTPEQWRAQAPPALLAELERMVALWIDPVLASDEIHGALVALVESDELARLAGIPPDEAPMVRAIVFSEILRQLRQRRDLLVTEPQGHG